MPLQTLMDIYEEEFEQPIPRARIPQRFSLEKTHTPTQLMLAEREKDYFWDTETTTKDRNAYYALAHKVLAKQGESKLVGILNWGREKRCHIRQLLKVLASSQHNKAFK